MSEVQLVVREPDQDWSGTVHGSDADRAIAALSADPVTLEELEAALARFLAPEPGRRALCNLRRGLNDEPYDAGLVVIDLPARLVAVESTYSSPGPRGTVCYHDGSCETDVSISYGLAEDWKFVSGGESWSGWAKQRRRERAGQPSRDVRAILYGLPLIEFLARESLATFARRHEIAAAVRAERKATARRRLARNSGVSPDQIDEARLTEEEITPRTWPGQEHYGDLFYGTLRGIHAAWLLTPREELDRLSPREVALKDHRHIESDLQSRCSQWSWMNACPPGLSESSHAYRYGGFGTHELVMYYDLVRELLWSCWGRLIQTREGAAPRELGLDDFLATEIGRLEIVREVWLDEPNLEFDGRTPRSIIERERKRLPEAVSGHGAVIDPDCPCCQMMADMPGPTFWHLDGSGMDDDFAFAFWHTTLEEWESERREWDALSRKLDTQREERGRLGIANESIHGASSDSIWSRTTSIGAVADVPLGARILEIGFRLADLIVALRGGADRDGTPPGVQSLIECLNRDFGNLREVLRPAAEPLSDTLLDAVVARFRETLETVESSRDELELCCSALSHLLDALANPPEPPSAWEPGSLDLPF